jgi:hypothetical protein
MLAINQHLLYSGFTSLPAQLKISQRGNRMYDVNTRDMQESCFVESVKELDSINKKIARLIVRKEELTDVIIGALEHEHEGQKSYEYDMWKLEVKTPFIYCLNKRAYESEDFKIPQEFNPIKESISYTVDKRLCDKYLNEAPDEVRSLLIEVIDKKPGKASVTIRERV